MREGGEGKRIKRDLTEEIGTRNKSEYLANFSIISRHKLDALRWL